MCHMSGIFRMLLIKFSYMKLEKGIAGHCKNTYIFVIYTLKTSHN